ncbi:MAG: hypothetical protein A2144_08280 [Chloroflexi bacterium RBG_16_50_9]|nr:MAG: hypothetical protein A2144_08280 [Chloroflexi bacterium RBG_16_50_9]
MKLSTRSCYGTRALLELALHHGEEPVQLKDIARSQQIPLQYLAHIITPLISAGMVRSTRGAKGGVSLARNPEEIKLNEVVQILEGSIAPAECLNNSSVCDRSPSCVTRDIWSELQEAMEVVLASTTLQDLEERHKNKKDPQPAMYYI